MDAAIPSSTLTSWEKTARATSKTVEQIPWFCFVVSLAALCIPLGVLWDISWHSTIGRDTFWTPAHLMIHFGGVVPGLVCGYLILRTTFIGTPEEKAACVQVLGFRGQLGAFVTCWGSLSMLLSAPFDDWWHDAYGLDVQILSPPHSLLALGMYGVAVGALLLVLSWQNRAEESARGAGSLLFVLGAGVLLAMQSIMFTEKSYPNLQHSGFFYIVSSINYVACLAMVSRAARRNWAMTTTAALYSGIVLAMVWFLPLFEAQPKLAPIYRPVTHMVPPSFPLLLIVPAFFLDLYIGRTRDLPKKWWTDWVIALGFSAIYTLVFMGAQWNFAKFLVSPAANNAFFAGNQMWPYFAHVGNWETSFDGHSEKLLNQSSFLWALLAAFLASRWGLFLGRAMSRVQR